MAARIGAAAAACALVLSGTAGPSAGASATASSSLPSATPTVPDLPWGTISTAIGVVAAVTTPIRAVWQGLAEMAASVPGLDTVAVPAQRLGDLVTAGLPALADGAAVLSRLRGRALDVSAVPASDGQAWQVPDLPDASQDLVRFQTSLGAFLPAVVAARDCGCLSGIQTPMTDLAATLTEAEWALDAYAPLLGPYRALAGYEEARTYLVVIGNQAEMRPSGGAPLYAAVVTADAGLIQVVDKGVTSTHFFPPLNRPVTWTGVDGNPFFDPGPRSQPFVNAGANPDFSISAQEMADAFAAGGHPTVDGVVFVDLSLLQEVLRLTGPLDAPGVGVVDADSLVPVVLDNAYDEADSPEANARRQAANDALVESLLTRLSAGLPALPTLRAIEEAVQGRHLQVWFRDEATQETFDSVGWTGRLAAPSGTDWLAWYTQSGNPSKTDVRQSGTVTRAVEVTDDGLSVTTTYLVANDNVALGLGDEAERRGYQATWMRTAVLVYLPPAATSAAVTGMERMKPAPLSATDTATGITTDAAGNPFLRFAGWIPPQESASITVTYRLPRTAIDEYAVTLEPQLGITDYTATVTVTEGSRAAASFGPALIDRRTEVVLPIPAGD